MIGTQGSMVQYWGRLPGTQYPTAHWRCHVGAARSASRCAFEVAWFGGVIGAKITPPAIAGLVRGGVGAHLVNGQQTATESTSFRNEFGVNSS